MKKIIKKDEIEYAIFDMDGTIIDSMYAWDTAADRMLLSMGITPLPNMREEIRPMTTLQVANYVMEHYSVKLTAEELTDMFNKTMEEFYKTEADFKEGAYELLCALHDAGVGMCIATATDRYMTEGVLRRLGVLHLFDFIVTCSEVGQGKSSPLVFDAALSRCGASRERTWVFEDSYFAVRTAHDAGYRVLAVYDLINEPFENIKQEFSDVYVRSLKELQIIK